MKYKRLLMMLLVAAGFMPLAPGTLTVEAQQRPVNQPPAGFTALFNGRDLTGWRGRQPNYNPATEAALPKAELDAKQAEWNAARDLHWKVDTAKGEIVSDGSSPHLATVKNYGNFEMYVDWLMVSNNGDSGIYLRGYPQVQIWDPSNARELRNGADKGSGALWNNKEGDPGRFPLVKTDNPIGSWNTLKIKMIGDRVWISMNDKVTVDGQVLGNYFAGRAGAPANLPLVTEGPIELQTHGSEIRFRNVFVREIGEAEAKAALAR